MPRSSDLLADCASADACRPGVSMAVTAIPVCNSKKWADGRGWDVGG
jgi:hypothetical protein